MADKEIKDHWDISGQIFYCGGRGWGLNKELQTICVAVGDVTEKGTIVPRAATKVPASGCASFARCSAPLCPLDKSSLKNGIWYPDEPVCNRRDERPVWVEIQKRIAKKAKDKTRYFTLQDFQRKRVQNPKGHNSEKGIK